MQELRAKAEAASYLRDDSDIDQKVSDAAVQPSTSSTSTAAATVAGYGTIPNGLPSGKHCYMCVSKKEQDSDDQMAATKCGSTG